MKIKHCIAALFLVVPFALVAKGTWKADNIKIGREGDRLAIEFDLDLSGLDVESSRALLFTPVLANEAHSLDLRSIGVYGRRRYYHYLRRDGNMLSDSTEVVFRNVDKPDVYRFSQTIPYEEWMNGSRLDIQEFSYGCCHKLLSEDEKLLASYEELVPVTVKAAYMRVQGTYEKKRELSGEAWVQFVVNRTEIRPELFNNPQELGKITASIDSVKKDSDVTITNVWLKGFASPESPYSHNADLARGRVKAVSDYIQQLYKFDKDIISTDYEPEDWAGLRRYVENSNLNHRAEILAMIDSDMDPDLKEAKIKKTFPEEYSHLLKFAYPPLRHTEYRIDYTVRDYTDVEEIKRIMATAPHKLDQNEFYLLAETFEPGSPEYNDVFETCVRMYPDDENANLNAAMAALETNDVARADKYLLKAGNSPEADYGRGMSALIKDDFDEARRLLERCSQAGLIQAEDGLRQLASRIRQMSDSNN